MRRLLAAGVVVALLVAILAVADVVTRHTVEHDIATRIESSVPGTTATVRIPSQPFLGHLAVSGSVPTLDAHVTGLKVGPFTVDTVDVAVTGIKVARSDLLQGKVALRSISSAAVTGFISQQSVDAGAGLPVTLGDGTVGLAGIQLPARVALVGGHVTISVPSLATITLPALPASLVPCSAGATITPGGITLSCTTTTLPPALVAAATS